MSTLTRRRCAGVEPQDGSTCGLAQERPLDHGSVVAGPRVDRDLLDAEVLCTTAGSPQMQSSRSCGATLRRSATRFERSVVANVANSKQTEQTDELGLGSQPIPLVDLEAMKVNHPII